VVQLPFYPNHSEKGQFLKAKLFVCIQFIGVHLLIKTGCAKGQGQTERLARVLVI